MYFQRIRLKITGGERRQPAKRDWSVILSGTTTRAVEPELLKNYLVEEPEEREADVKYG